MVISGSEEEEDFHDLVSTFIFTSHVNANVTDLIPASGGHGRLFKDVQEKVGSAKNIILWSGDQLSILEDADPSLRRLCLNSDYGTGKAAE